MGTARLQPNTTQIPHIILREWLPKLSDTELRIILIIADQTYGWHKESDRIAYSLLIAKTGSSNGSIASALRFLREEGYIQVTDENGNLIRTKEEARGKNLYYRINITSPKIGDDLSKNRTPKIGDTKETNTKAFTNVKDDVRPKGRLSCPLLKNQVLYEKYPRGHIECVEYITSFKFVNKDKQFRFLHQILRTGLDFPDIDHLIARLEKKPYFQENGYDFATIAGEADRRLNASP